MEKINYTTLLAFRPVFSVAASGEYVEYALLAAP